MGSLKHKSADILQFRLEDRRPTGRTPATERHPSPEIASKVAGTFLYPSAAGGRLSLSCCRALRLEPFEKCVSVGLAVWAHRHQIDDEYLLWHHVVGQTLPR